MDNLKPTLETTRLILRQPTLNDLAVFQSWAGNPENTRFMSFGPNTLEETLDWLKTAKAGCDFAIVLKQTGAVIGSGGIYPDQYNHTASIGWIFHIDHWKNGYGTEFGRELIRYGFEDLKVERIEALCADINQASWRIMERNGMHREGLLRKAFFARVDKEWIDKAVYSILKEDYFADKQT